MTTKHCTTSTRSNFLASILEQIPRSDQNAVPLFSLCSSTTKDDSTCESCILSMLTMLQVFDAIIVGSDNSTGNVTVKAKSQAALYFLRSFAQYLRKDLVLVSNWKRIGIGHEFSLEKSLNSGAHLVYLMEHRRTVDLGDLSPIREEHVSKVIIKAKIRGKRKSVYLVQYDEKAYQFQLIGGRMRSTDSDALTVMKREIEEELAPNHFVHIKDYDLRELASNIQVEMLSHTYGAYSSYDFTFYQAFIKRSQIILGPNDKWVTLSELLAGRTKDGVLILENGIEDLDKQLHGGLDGLRLSLDEVQMRSFSEMVKEKPFEWIGLALGILGIILSILFFFLQN